ncbi:MAG TPA: cysteine hydrolase family protein, partial [Draconibacterium sp.]|nr:cysteine hydrolase family protein [Draconibacterium sp.]
QIIMKKLILVVIMLFSLNTFAQKLDSTALILIDIQYFYFPGGDMPLVEPEAAALQAQRVLEYFRKNKGLVVHVKHAHEPGGNIHELVKPVDGEKIFTKKEVNSFLGTGLDNYLKENHIKYVVLAGMQTHMCLEGGTRAAHDLGYQCTVIEDACATRDLKYGERVIKAVDVHASTLATLKNYAKIVTTEEFLK